MEKKIPGLRWTPRCVSQLGCIKGCLDFLRMNVSDAWIYGATGYAFIINVSEIVCPSGPTSWNRDILAQLGKNIGYDAETIMAVKTDFDYQQKLEKVWEKTKAAIDNGRPCFGWEMEIPEFYVIYGYDEIGYYFSGSMCDAGKGPKPWGELGKSNIGILEMHYIKQVPSADDVLTIKQALVFSLNHAYHPEKWTSTKYKTGLQAYDNWIKAIETSRANIWGMAYNAMVWRECREMAARFLTEAQRRLGGNFEKVFEDAIGSYRSIALLLKKVSELFPYPPQGNEINDYELCKKAVEYLKEARKSEESALIKIQKIVNILY